MARALPAGTTPRRRALFGLLDGDGWGWASVKAFFWFIVIIFLLGYIPDRAYYFTVGRTLDLGILAFSPVNFCPPENESLPCPAPQGAIIPWEPAPPELSLPAPRTDGALVQFGTEILFIGGSDGTTAAADVYVARTSGTGNFDRWEAGPSLPEPRSDAGVAFFSGSVFVVGGFDADGQPTDTTFVLTPDTATGALGEWQTAEDAELPLSLPEPRAGSALVALADGLALVGGVGPDGTSTATAWKATLDGAELGEWTPQPQNLAVPVTDAVAVVNGDYIWVYGGTDAEGRATGAVQRGRAGTGDQEGQIVEWGVREVGNLPDARTDAAGWVANGIVYLAGGQDGSGTPRGEVYWAVPTEDTALGEIVNEWHHLPQSDLPAQGLAGAAGIASGSTAFLVGGETSDGVISGAARADLAPAEPFFRLGLLGATVPALKIDGEIGQQLGYLNAAGAGTVNFIILIVIGWMFAHRERTRELWDRVRRRRS